MVVGPEDREDNMCCVVGVTSMVAQRQAKSGNALSFFFQSALAKVPVVCDYASTRLLRVLLIRDCH